MTINFDSIIYIIINNMQKEGLMVSQILSSTGQNDTEFTFDNTSYIFPNNIDFCKSFKSCVTILQIPQKDLTQIQFKKLSTINKSRYVIKLKQIKKQSSLFAHHHNPNTNTVTQYKLYYEVIPFSLSFVKTTDHFNLKHVKMEKILKDIVCDLIDFNIYCELNVQSCGFTELGEFKIFIPPTYVINQKKLSSAEKVKLNTSSFNILKFWEKQHAKVNNPSIIHVVGPNGSHGNHGHSNNGNGNWNGEKKLDFFREKVESNDDDQNALKKTIKLSKSNNVSKDISKKIQEKSYANNRNQMHKNTNLNNKFKTKHTTNEMNINSQNLKKSPPQSTIKEYRQTSTNIQTLKEPSFKLKQSLNNSQKQPQEIKKYKSMQQILNISDKESKNIKKMTYKSKINEINQKLNTIKSSLLPKKAPATTTPLQPNLAIQSKQKNLYNLRYKFNDDGNLQQNVIYENKDKDKYLQVPHEQYGEGQSFDTYLDEIGSQYTMPNFNLDNQLRKTASPAQFLLLKNALRPKESSNNNWKHESAGNNSFKSIIKKNQELYPQIMNQNYSIKSKEQSKRISKTPTKKQDENRMLKKILSLQFLDNKMETMSFHLSQFSKDMVNNRRKIQKQQKQTQLKEKVQDILIKSKKAIQLLKSPNKHRLSSNH